MVCNALSLPSGSSLQRCGAVLHGVRTVKRGAGRISGLPLNLQGRAAGCGGGSRSRGAAQCIGRQGSGRRPAAGPAGTTAGVLALHVMCLATLGCGADASPNLCCSPSGAGEPPSLLQHKSPFPRFCRLKLLRWSSSDLGTCSWHCRCLRQLSRRPARAAAAAHRRTTITAAPAPHACPRWTLALHAR
jgi:hypothetical protein